MSTRAPLVLMVMGVGAALIYWLWPHWPDALGAATIKASAVASFALYASARVVDRDGWAIVAVMALGALGDLLIEWRLEAGAAVFAVGHVIATRLYWHHRAENGVRWPWLLVPACVGLTAWLTPDNGAALYALFVSAMAVSALNSRFARPIAGPGALLFLASDLLIFARLGGRLPDAVAHLLIWPLYVIGQALICLGVTSALNRRALRAQASQ